MARAEVNLSALSTGRALYVYVYLRASVQLRMKKQQPTLRRIGLRSNENDCSDEGESANTSSQLQSIHGTDKLNKSNILQSVCRGKCMSALKCTVQVELFSCALCTS